MSGETLEHITITTGAGRISPRSEVPDDIIDGIRLALIDGDRQRADLPNGWRVEIIPGAPADGIWVFDLYHHGDRMVACWLCDNPDYSDFLWGIAARAGSLTGARLHKPARTPWLAAAICAPVEMMLADAERVRWTLFEAADLERCVAWALLP